LNRLAFWFDRPRHGAGRRGQPRPIETRICRVRVCGRWVSMIGRKWLYDDVPRCRLCPTCTAVGGECNFLVTELVTDQDAPLYSIGHQ
jgi:hypothetical protein